MDKKKFLESLLDKQYDDKRIFDDVFKNLERFEEKLDKDFCTFNFTEIDYFFSEMKFGSLYPIKFYRYCLGLYTKWCLDNCYSQYDNIAEIPVRKFVEYITKQNNSYIQDKAILTPYELQCVANQLINPCDRYILYALFEGIKGDEFSELINLEKSNFIEEPNGWYVLLENDKKISVMEGFARTALISANTFYYISFNDEEEKTNVFPLYQQKPGQIYKPRANITSNNSIMNRVNQRILKIKDMLDMPDLTVSVLRHSGLVYYISQLSDKEKIPVLKLIKLPQCKEIMQRYNLKELHYKLVKQLFGSLEEKK